MDVTKIIKATAVRGRTSTAAPIIKEDYGLYLLIGGIDLPEVYEVDFSNEEHAGTSVTMVGNADGVLIPNQFIKSGKDVFAFYYHVGEDFGRTLYTIRIPNKLRPDRTDIQPTPAEQSTIDQLISALNTAVEQTGEDAESASQSAQSAEQSAQNAQTYALSANTASDTAENFADAASSYASQAEQAKDTAEVYVGTAKGYAEQADASATASANSALASAQRASASADSATQAQGYANNASASAQSASTSASNASTSAQTASTKASEASTSAQTASTKATESAQSASQALSYKTDAESAKTASQTAQGLAESARDSAITAKTDAESAKADAESARDEAQQAVASISDALADKAPVIIDTASGAIASFTDGADNLPLKSLVVNIDPVQDLHGQDSPYPAGGGKNLLPPIETITNNGITFSQSGDYININGTATANAYVALFSGVLPSGDYVINGMTGAGNSTWRVGIKIGDASWVYASGGERTFTSDGTTTIQVYLFAYPAYGAFDNLKVQYQLERGTTPTSWSPYENICPISGWTEVDVEQSGVNIWDEEWELGDISASTGENAVSNTVIRTKNYIPVKPNTQYFVYINDSGSGPLRGRFYDINKDFIGTAPKDRTSVTYNQTFTTPDNCYYMRFTPQATYGTTYNHDISINYPSTDHDYHPYTGRSITIDLGRTVYGGTLNVLTGELVIDRAMVDLGTLNWIMPSDNRFYTTSLSSVIKKGTDGALWIQSSMFRTTSSLSVVYNSLNAMWLSASGNISVSKIADTAAALKTAVTGQQLVYELATPITIQLTPNQVNSLLGVNNIWADSGDTEVEYRADTKAYIAKKIAEAIASLT